MIGKIGIDRTKKQEVLRQITDWVSQKQSALIVTPYSEMIVYAEYDEDFAQSMAQADVSVPDGVGVLWAGMYVDKHIGFIPSLLRIPARHVDLFAQFPEQVRGSELIYNICDMADTQTLRVYILGGKPEVLDTFVKKCEIDYPRMVITGSFDGVIDETTNVLEVFQKVADSHSDIVLVNLSVPLQEKWGAGLKAFLIEKDCSGVICCLGGSLDMMVGYQRKAPSIFRWFGLEWLWRVLCSPRRIRRIYRAVVEFPILVRRYKHSKV